MDTTQQNQHNSPQTNLLSNHPSDCNTHNRLVVGSNPAEPTTYYLLL